MVRRIDLDNFLAHSAEATVWQPQQDDWRTAEFVSITNAAHILGYTPATVRNLISGGGLKAVQQAHNGPKFIVVKSLMELIDSAKPA